MESEPAHDPDQRSALVRRLIEFPVAVQFAGILSFAALWWWLMPKGFPVWHSRFWMNTALPPYRP